MERKAVLQLSVGRELGRSCMIVQGRSPHSSRQPKIYRFM